MRFYFLLQVVYILENRARSVDLSTHDYYSLLYAFFTYRENNGKGAELKPFTALVYPQKSLAVEQIKKKKHNACVLAIIQILSESLRFFFSEIQIQMS